MLLLSLKINLELGGGGGTIEARDFILWEKVFFPSAKSKWTEH